MSFPNNEWNETHFGTDEDDTHIITLSHLEDIVYVFSLYVQDNTDDELGEKGSTVYDQVILEGQSAQEFLYGWAGEEFAKRVLDKDHVLEMHSYAILSADHIIHIIVCGPSNETLKEKVDAYIDALKICSYFDL